MKKFILLLPLLFFFCVTAKSQQQDLLTKIPANANAVINIKAPQFAQMLSPDEFSKTLAGKKLLEFFGKQADKEFKHINELGVNFSQNAYFFRLENDSISFNCFLMGIANAARFNSIVYTKNGIVKTGSTNSTVNLDSTAYMMWNDQHALIVNSNLKDYYFDNEEISKRHGLVYPAPYSYSYGRYADVDEAIPADSTYANGDAAADTSVVAVPDTAIVEPPKIEDEYIKEEAEDKYNQAYYDSVRVVNEANYEKNLRIKKQLAFSLMETCVKKLFNTNPAQSIAGNPQYLASTDDKAAVTVWVKDPASLYYNNLFGSSGGMYNRYSPLTGGVYNSLFGGRMNFGYDNLVSKLYVEENNIHMSSSLDLDEESAASYRKIYKRKLNKQFLKYIQSDSLLGYMSFSLDTKSYLEELPKMYERILGNVMNSDSSEVGIFAEMMSLLLDEKAVGDMINGDGLVLFNGVYNVTTTYTDYEYDDNFKAKEVQKTKEETLPKFLFMFSGEENNLVKKIIKYGIKKEYMKLQGTYYEIGTKDLPIRLYFMQKDGIFFFSNSFNDMQMISAGGIKSNLAKEMKKDLLTSNFTTFIRPERIASTLSASGAEITGKLTDAINTFKGMGPIYMKTLPLKDDNKMKFEARMDVPDGKGNSLKYLFGLIDAMIQLDEKQPEPVNIPDQQR